MTVPKKVCLKHLSLRSAPALIETVFPAQKLSLEAQTERKAVAAQTLTGLGSYWKGRKPLILVRAIVLGSMLPPTDNPTADMAIFEKLMAFDGESLARRALAKKKLSITKIQQLISISNPDRYFRGGRWQRWVSNDEKIMLYRRALDSMPSYEEKIKWCKRPEEVDQAWLYSPTWSSINLHYACFGINVNSFVELIEQLSVLRFGRRLRVGDAFCGGGSIPFESARIGCDVYASDLNPVACMLTWGAFNVLGASFRERDELKKAQRDVFSAVNAELTSLGIEHDAEGNRAKCYLYCLETRCPETGWMIPLAPSWIISPKQGVVAKLVPDQKQKRFDIKLNVGVSKKAMAEAEKGTIRDKNMVYELQGRIYRTPIKTLRGDYRQPNGKTGNKLRRWKKGECAPQKDDIFQERLYAIQWIKKDTSASRSRVFFAAPTDDDLEREKQVMDIVARELNLWQRDGLVPDMSIEPGGNTSEPIRVRGWTHWHHLFNPRQLLLQALLIKHWSASKAAPLGWLNVAKAADFNSKLSRWKPSNGGGLGGPVGTFSNQLLNTLYNYATRAWFGFGNSSFKMTWTDVPPVKFSITPARADQPAKKCDFWITDPPYADAVNYHEITEFFIAWLRKYPPKPFDKWIWDSRRPMAIRGIGAEFRRGMVMAYRALANKMSDNGIQCVMFTHQNTRVWGDLVGIFWAAGLQVVSAWYIATETPSKLKQGGYVQGTVILMLKKRPQEEQKGFKQHLLPKVKQEVGRQIQRMLNLNDSIREHHGEPSFNDSDLQMAGYAAALKVLTAYTQLGGEDVTAYAAHHRDSGEETIIDEIVQQAAETAAGLLVPKSLSQDTWNKLSGIERFVCRMMSMEFEGAKKLDNYQNFAKAFRIDNYSVVMGDMSPNHARLKHIDEFTAQDLLDSTEIGGSRLGPLIVALQQAIKDVEPRSIVEQLRDDLADFLEVRPVLVNLLEFIEQVSLESPTRQAAETLAARLRNLRLGA